MPSSLTLWRQFKLRDETRVKVPRISSNIVSSGDGEIDYQVFHLTWLIDIFVDLEINTAMGSLEETGFRVSLSSLRIA